MSIEEIKETLKNSLSEPFVICENKKFPCIDGNDEFSYTPALSVLKEQKVVAVIESVGDSMKKETVFRDLWRYCNEACLFIVVDNIITIRTKVRAHLIPPISNYDLRYIRSMDNFMRKQPVECKMEKLADYIMSYELECNRSISKSIFFKKVNKLAQKYELYRELQLFEERLLNLNVDDIVEFDDTNCWLHRNYENMLMCCILGSVELHDRIFRYTGSDTLRYILGDCTHAMCSLVTMNDTSEVDYANTYIKKSSGEYNNSDQTKEATNTFVVSFCDKEIEDDLTMWRLYGDNTRGVSIEYEYEEELDLNIFQLARVSYAEKNGNHPKLDFIRELMHLEFEEFKFSLKKWVVWQHFFKPCDYRIEQEIRLLLFYDELIGVPRGKCHEWITTADGITAPILKLSYYVCSRKTNQVLLSVLRF